MRSVRSCVADLLCPQLECGRNNKSLIGENEMQNRTLAIVITVITALACGCASIFSGVWGFLIATGTPIDITTNGITTPQVLSPTIGYTLLCLTIFMILVPVAVGFITLRKRSDVTTELPPMP